MKTIELNEQQVRILQFELNLILENENLGKTTQTVLEQINNKLNQE